jgi:NAD-dependent dihydropyrimidine dehydrogenase PreA subunit
MAKGLEKLNKIKTEYVWVNPQNCIVCWKCIDACPKQVLGKAGFLWHRHVVVKNAGDCMGCKGCIEACPNGVFTEKMPHLLKALLANKGVNLS